MIATDEARTLLARAHEAASRAYVPYSRFPVGAALVTASGRVYEGVNVENASYGLTICAERTAAVKAVSEGDTVFRAIAVASPRVAPCPPCGACLQFLTEFDHDTDLILEEADGTPHIIAVRDTIRLPFGAGHLAHEAHGSGPGGNAR